MATGFESYGLAVWICVFIFLIIFITALCLCCYTSNDEQRGSSRNQTSRKAYDYDPRTDGVVDSGPSLYSNHFYNSPYNNDGTTYNHAGGSIHVQHAGDDNGHHDGHYGHHDGHHGHHDGHHGHHDGHHGHYGDDSGHTGGDNGACGGNDGGDCGGGGDDGGDCD